MALETLITFLTIENNNMNNYIVTFEYRVMVTAFAILAMFLCWQLPWNCLRLSCWLPQTWKPWQKWTVGGLRVVSGGCRLEPSLWGAQGTQVLSGAKHQQSLRLCSARQSQWMITAILVTQPWFPAKSVFFVEVFSPVNCNPQFENWIGLCLPLSLLDSPKMLSQRSKKCFRN